MFECVPNSITRVTKTLNPLYPRECQCIENCQKEPLSIATRLFLTSCTFLFRDCRHGIVKTSITFLSFLLITNKLKCFWSLKNTRVFCALIKWPLLVSFDEIRQNLSLHFQGWSEREFVLFRKIFIFYSCHLPHKVYKGVMVMLFWRVVVRIVNHRTKPSVQKETCTWFRFFMLNLFCKWTRGLNIMASVQNPVSTNRHCLKPPEVDAANPLGRRWISPKGIKGLNWPVDQACS